MEILPLFHGLFQHVPNRIQQYAFLFLFISLFSLLFLSACTSIIEESSFFFRRPGACRSISTRVLIWWPQQLRASLFVDAHIGEAVLRVTFASSSSFFLSFALSFFFSPFLISFLSKFVFVVSLLSRHCIFLQPQLSSGERRTHRPTAA